MDDITVLVFGPLRERVGVAEVHVDGATVQEVWDELVRRHPAAALDAGSVREFLDVLPPIVATVRDTVRAASADEPPPPADPSVEVTA